MTVESEAVDASALMQVLHQDFKVPLTLLHDAATFGELGLDSMALMELLLRLEDMVGDGLADRLGELSPVSTLGDAAAVLLGPGVPRRDE
ncbi:phosphopantetheine-binding protein [Streptomyces sp. NPDC053048]|uniref:phosphopantetheine-binding protein n=1 Tax=Streptomyces sp. NPDC053048 TaxID=3365694 RepID=UPI0037D2E07E